MRKLEEKGEIYYINHKKLGNKIIISTSGIDINDWRMKLLEILYKR